MSRALVLLRLLADGELHSGEALARTLGVSRAAVSKQARHLKDLGLEVTARAGRGYRLAAAIELLAPERILAALGAKARARVRRLEVLDEVPSTNDRLLAVRDARPGLAEVVFAEFQSAGRGRRGRQWLAPYGSGLCLSLGWLYPEPRQDLSAVTLCVGVALLRALASLGVTGLSLKWPNDVHSRGAKLAGILCELRAEGGGPAYVVVGVGMNVTLPRAAQAALARSGTRATDLARHVAPAPAPTRNALAGALVREIIAALEQFASQGLAAFAPEWLGADALAGQAVEVHAAGQVRTGVARGIAADGALEVAFAEGVVRVTSGEVTLRAAP